jgi:hypothetical protein
MHDKGGPIQHYGACAACHDTMPFHAKPSDSGSRDYDGGRYRSGGGGAGRGIFNLFVSQFSGSDRRRSTSDSVDFSLTQIEHVGKVYTVPYFTDGPATAGLAVCTSCHGDNSAKVSCDNVKWRDHLTLNRVPLATYQLAEATYIGSLCPGSSPTLPTNLALNKTATASSSESSTYGALKAVDGNIGTYWYKRSSSQHWLRVDLGSRQSLSKVVIKWGTEYSRSYNVEVSSDGSSWTRVKSATSADGGDDTITFTAREARYVRINCSYPRNNGYQIKELEVYK